MRLGHTAPRENGKNQKTQKSQNRQRLTLYLLSIFTITSMYIIINKTNEIGGKQNEQNRFSK